MTDSLFTIIFAIALTAMVSTRLWLARRQIAYVAAHRDRVPSAFAGEIGLPAHHKAADYTAARQSLGRIETVIDTLLLLFLTLGGGFAALVIGTAMLPISALWQDVAAIASLVVIGGVASLPFSLYSTFVIEERFGFNRMTLKLFVADLAKGVALGALLGLPLLYVVLWLMREAGALWWLYAWAAWMAFQLVMLVAYPTLIAPLFNRFQPLPQGEARSRIEALLARCGFASSGLFVMDGSRRSGHGNAYFTGLGRAKRVVFFDTLLSRLKPEEIEAVLAHELGHFKRRHIAKRIAWSSFLSLAFLATLAWLVDQPWFYQGLGIPESLVAEAMGRPGVAMGLFFLALPVFTFALSPIAASYSRRHEFEADAFAAQAASGSALVNALVKLYEDNASTLTPDPVHSAFYDSHPPAAIRVARLCALAGASATGRL
ncbi:MAG TPA: M48 family metallopeptidase [Casimicrobiaceae bacterium]|nr:M48 family metallopeptidase [Casimicrobiaceae bacterium]